MNAPADRFRFPFAILMLLPGLLSALENGDPELEVSVCGLQEPVMFWLWSGMAGNPDAGRLAGLQHVDDITFETRDGRMLRGYRLRATDTDGQPVAAKGYLLVMQGNAILADRILGAFAPFASAGMDVYVYDFRGYGRSGGRRRLKAIVSDYAEITAALDAADYEQHLVYAMSFGGIALLDGLASHGRLDRVVIDSTPARLSGYGCPPEYDPVDHLPADTRHFLVIVGGSDRVVTSGMSRELVETAGGRGAEVIRDEAFAHPFMDRDRSVHRRRMRVIEEFLLR
jgi:alpha-beta hydrolase superfamily lysophospholipase